MVTFTVSKRTPNPDGVTASDTITCQLQVPTYSGSSSEFIHWHEEFSAAALALVWSDSQKKTALSQLLRGDARSHFVGNSSATTILDKLRADAFPPTSYAHHFAKLRSVRKFDSESARSYLRRLQSLSYAVELTQGMDYKKYPVRELRYLFMSGFPVNIAQELLSSVEDTLENTLLHAERLEAAQRITRQSTFQQSQKINKKGSSQPSQSFNRHSSNADTYKPSASSNNNSNKSTNKYCSHHKVTSHDSSECKVLASKSTSNSSKSYSTSVTRAIQLSNDILCPIFIKGKPFNALVDTGSTISLISSTIAQRLNITSIDPPINLKVANGNSSRTQGSSTILVKIPQLPNVEIPQTFHILDNSSVDVILGVDFLKLTKANISLCDNTITFTTPVCPPTVSNTIASEFSSSEEFNPDDLLLSKLCATVTLATPSIGPPSDLENLLSKFSSISGNDNNIGCFPGTTHDIPLLPNSSPCHLAPYRIPFTLEPAVKEEIQKLLRLNIIRPSKSPYASPAFPIKKKNGSIRLVVDYRKLNAITSIHRFPLPRPEDLLLRLHGSKVFSQLDLNSGYFQIPVSLNDIPKTAFVLPFGHFEFLRMPFGLAAAPMTFQQAMSTLFSSYSFVSVFMDDILIHSPDPSSHLEHLEIVFNILKSNNLTINSEKCTFHATTVTYLGLEISANGIRPAQRNLETLKTLSNPKSKTGIRRIIGCINFFRSMIPNLSTRLASITSKTSSSAKFSWSADDEAIVQSIVSGLINTARNFQPDFSKPFQIYTDASDSGVGGIVSQDGKLIQCFSRKLNSAQTKYTVTEKEALAIVWLLQHCRTFLFGRDLEIFTDHSNLSFLSTSNLQRVQRWKLVMDEFGPKITYFKGSLNTAADTLSRLHTVNLIDSNNLDYPLDPSIIQEQQQHDPDTQSIISHLTTSSILVLASLPHMPFTTPVLHHRSTLGLYVPLSLRQPILSWFHTSAQHPGITKMYQSLRPLVYWSTLHADIISFVNSCHPCQLFKSTSKQYGLLVSSLNSSTPFKNIAIDILGPFTFTNIDEDDFENDESTYCLTIIDICTRWIELIPLHRVTALTVCSALDHQWLCRYPRPDTISSDQGVQFLSSEFQELLSTYGITHSTTTTYNPQANSVVERAHGFINNAVRCSQSSNLASLLPAIAWSLRTTFHSTLGCAPANLVFGCSMLNSSLLFNTQDLLQKSIALKTKRTQSDLTKSNKKRIQFSYEPGQSVYVKTINPTKTESRYSGPHLLHSVKESNNTARVYIDNLLITYNFRRLKPCLGENDNVAF